MPVSPVQTELSTAIWLIGSAGPCKQITLETTNPEALIVELKKYLADLKYREYRRPYVNRTFGSIRAELNITNRAQLEMYLQAQVQQYLAQVRCVYNGSLTVYF